jgi:hypothetical protein
MISFIWAWGGTVLAVAITVWAVLRGGSTEKYGAIINLICWFLTPLVQTKAPGIDIGVTLVDTGLLTTFLWLSLRSRELWAAFAAAFQFLCLIGDFAIGLTHNVSLYTYITGNGLWGGYAILATLIAGMISAEKRRKQELPS